MHKVKSTGEMTCGYPVDVVLIELCRTFTLTCCYLSSISLRIQRLRCGFKPIFNIFSPTKWGNTVLKSARKSTKTISASASLLLQVGCYSVSTVSSQILWCCLNKIDAVQYSDFKDLPKVIQSVILNLMLTATKLKVLDDFCTWWDLLDFICICPILLTKTLLGRKGTEWCLTW